MKSKQFVILAIGFLTMSLLNSNEMMISKDLDFRISKLKSSATSGRIHINRNWTSLQSLGICVGEGTNLDPYLIEDLVIDGEEKGYCILVENSEAFFIIKNCTIGNGGSNFNDAGIKFVNVTNGQLRGNIVVSNCYYGFNFDYSSNNLIVGNVFTTHGSVRFTDSSDNRMYMNDIDSSSISIYFGPNSNNYYCSASQITYNYHGNTFTNYIGNFWNDYDGNDVNSDGIGDSPVEFTDSTSYIVDNYPLMEPIENYQITPPLIPGYNFIILITLLAFAFGTLVLKIKKNS